MIKTETYTRNNQGFTIIELMIALSVLSVLLVMASAILIRIGNLYTKGVNTANLQNTTRTISADVSSGIQVSDNSISRIDSGGASAYCIGATRYSFIQDKEHGTDYDGTTTDHVLWRDTLQVPTASCQPINFADIANDHSSLGDGYEMMPEHMRIVNFTVQKSNAVALSGHNAYEINLWIAYGDSDLVQTFDAIPADDTTEQANCKGDSGTQFCAVAHIDAITTQKIE
jgi:prepilin-type N-terminal cleavage/methylation domain-containing protein